MKLLSPRLKLILCASLASVAAAAVRAADQSEIYTYVIVYGAPAGRWEWKETGKHLLANGHTVYRVTLTALGERSHLSAEGVNLTTHINDVVNTILFEALHDVVLYGTQLRRQSHHRSDESHSRAHPSRDVFRRLRAE